MNRSAAAAIAVILTIALCAMLLIVALVTGDTIYLLVESAILHLALLNLAYLIYENGRRSE